MQQRKTGLSWVVERRLEFIEFRLYWEGGINRGDITEFFDVSVPQASKDLNQYQDLAPGNMTYDKSKKLYRAAENFKPQFLEPDPDQYLSQLRLIGEHISKPDETWLSQVPSLDCMPILRRKVDRAVLRTVVRAIRDKEAIEIEYQSMNPEHPEPMWRGISPHALASDGFRWHVRAYCHRDDIFKDFLLSRCLDCQQAGSAKARGEDDVDWRAYFDVHLKPNPKLSEGQQSIIADDFHMNDAEITIPVRKALLYYFEKRLRFDVSRALDRPQEMPVVIANRKEFDDALHSANGKRANPDGQVEIRSKTKVV